MTDSPIIVAGPDHSLSKQEVVDYYKDPTVQERLLQSVGKKPVLTVMQRVPGTPIYRRYDKKAPIRLSTPVLDNLVKKRTVEFHPTVGKMSKELWVDLDPGTDVSSKHLKQTVKNVEDVLKKIPGVINTSIVFSGGRGYHVRAELDKEHETEKLRKRLQESLRPLHTSNSALVNTPPKGKEIRLDTSTFHDQGSLRAPYSLNATTGLVALPVAREKLDLFQPKSDATIKSVLSKKEVGEFAPGIPRDRTMHPLPTADSKNWTMAVQKHLADRAGAHWDLRLVDPETQQAHSWAVPKASFPDAKPRLALQMPTHSADYALSFGSKGPQKIHAGYGKGTVEIEHKEPVKVLTVNPDKVVFKRDSGDTFSMRRTHENKWLFRKAANMSLLSRVKTDPFSPDLMEEALMDSSEPVALAALSRQDLPPEMLVDFSQNISPRVRAAVAQHTNVPIMTKKRMANSYKIAEIYNHSSFYRAGYQDTLAKLGAVKGRSTGMRGENLAYGEGHRPLESKDEHMPVGKIVNILHALPSARTYRGKTVLDNQEEVGDNNAEWGSAIQVRIPYGASPYLAGHEAT